MHPRTEELIAHLAAGRDALRLAVDAVPVPLRHRRPSPDRWSVADVVHHLSIVEGQIARLLAARIDAARAALLDVIRGADGLALGEVMFPHPAAGPLNGYAWIVFVGLHEARHAAQVREIRDAIETSVDRLIG